MSQCPRRSPPRRARGWRSKIPTPLRHGILIFLVVLVIEYLVVPELIGASHNLKLLQRLNIGWLIAGIVFEAASLFSYALLTFTILPKNRPSISRVFRIDLSTTAVAHLVPGGTAASAGLGYRLLTSEGVTGTDAGFTMATQGIGSAVVLNVMLWLALVISIPLAGFHPIYIVVALFGMLALLGFAALIYAFTRGEDAAARIVQTHRPPAPPRQARDQLEALLRRIGESLRALGRNRDLLRSALVWATFNWLLDAASLWAFLAALESFRQPDRALRRLRDRQRPRRHPDHPGRARLRRGFAAARLGELRRHQERRRARRARLALRQLLAADPGRRGAATSLCASAAATACAAGAAPSPTWSLASRRPTRRHPDGGQPSPELPENTSGRPRQRRHLDRQLGGEDPLEQLLLAPERPQLEPGIAGDVQPQGERPSWAERRRRRPLARRRDATRRARRRSARARSARRRGSGRPRRAAPKASKLAFGVPRMWKRPIVARIRTSWGEKPRKPAVLDQVGGVPVVVLPADVLADVVQQGAELEQLAVRPGRAGGASAVVSKSSRASDATWRAWRLAPVRAATERQHRPAPERPRVVEQLDGVVGADGVEHDPLAKRPFAHRHFVEPGLR